MDARKRGYVRGDAAMRWGDYIKRTAVRRVVWVLVGVAVYAVLSWFGVAHAAWHDDRAGAHSHCMQEAAAVHALRADRTQPATDHRCTHGLGGPSGAVGYYDAQVYERGGWRDINTLSGHGHIFRHSYGEECPQGGEWRDDLKRCFDPSECLARNQQPGFGVPTTRAWQSECVDGCSLEFDPNQGRVCTNVAGSLLCSGSLQWSGNQCSVPPGADPVEDTPPDRPDQSTCTAAGNGQSFCIKPNGEQCYSASNGRQVCWRPTETGEKPDRDTLQKRNAGQTEIPPANPNLPNGDTLEKRGESITTETTTSQGDSSSTTTTTTTNYGTQFGTNPGTGDEGEADDGSGGAEGGEGDDDEGSASGGGDCDTPPITTGDPVLGMVADQAWATRCAVEAGNAAKVTGDVGDCSQPFTVEGDNANAHQLRAMREQICGTYERGVNEGVSGGLDAEINSMEGEFNVSDVWGDGSDPGSIVTTRYGGGGSCPVISVELPGIGTWEPPPFFCSIIAALRLLFITVATVWGLRIIGS